MEALHDLEHYLAHAHDVLIIDAVEDARRARD